MNYLLTNREACQSINRLIVYFPISAYIYILKEWLVVHLFITGKKLTGKIFEYSTKSIIQLFLGRLAVKRWIGNDSLYTPHQALTNMWWLCNVKPDALSGYLQLQNHLFETLFLIRDLNGITYYQLCSIQIFEFNRGMLKCAFANCFKACRSSNKPSQ